MALLWRSVPLLALFCFATRCVRDAGARPDHSISLQREKREWIIPPQVLEENVDYTRQAFIARIRSDKEDQSKGPIRYELKGIGADQPPHNLFVVEPTTGNVRITGILDREARSEYNLYGVARYADNTVAENDIQLRIKVKDQNDNAPIFLPIETGYVPELSPIGTTVMKISATDADEPGNINSQILYEIVDQKPSGANMFTINQFGEVIVNNANLDRESIDQYVLTVRASDLNGAAGCNTGMSTFTVKVQDVNDNVPVLEQDSYQASIEENTENVEVMRLKAIDYDLEGSENWQVAYHIVSGNGGGHFKMVTDPKTNEGVLMLVKAVDFEEVKDMKLGIALSNVAPYHSSVAASQSIIGVDLSGAGKDKGTGMTGSNVATEMSGGGSSKGSSVKVYDMHVNVKNQPEGPKFSPKVKAIPISENGKMVDIKKVLTRYAATDTDTGLPATGVKYVKGSDRDNWLSIDENTGDIRLNKLPDRESPYLVNGTYVAEILAISQDMPSKTATGTIAIQVEDFNDHCPVLTNHTQTVCTTQEVLYVTAEDKDVFPNASPFKFTVIPEETEGEWSVEHLDDITAMLKPLDTLWPGRQKVTLDVRDQQGVSCPDKQVLIVEACICDESHMCNHNRAMQKSSTLGIGGIALILLGLLLLLLIPLLLLLCKCGAAGLKGAFADLPYETKERLISYQTEGQGEDMDVPHLVSEMDGQATMNMFTKASAGATLGAASGFEGGAAYGMSTMNGGGYGYNHIEMDSMGFGLNRQQQTGMMREEFSTYDNGMALSEDLLGHYYTAKSQEICDSAEENLLSFGLEGQLSPAGSVGCCSNLGSDNDLGFLDDLGPKFTTLAEICGGTKFTMSTPTPLPISKPIVEHYEEPPIPASVTSTFNMATNITATAPSTVHTEENVVVRNTQVVSDVKPVQTVIDVPTQTLMVQQQPLYYVVEPQVSNTVLLAERPAVGLTQGMFVLNSAPMTERVLVQGAVPAQATIGGGDRVVLLEANGGPTAALNTGLLQSANLSGSQLFMVDTGAQSGQVLHGTLQSGGISGSQGIMLVEGQGGSTVKGSLQRNVPVVGQSMVHVVERQGGISGINPGSLQGGFTTTGMSQNGTIGLNTSTIQGLPSTRKVVVQEKVVKTNL